MTEGTPEGNPGLGIVTVVPPGAGIVVEGNTGTGTVSEGNMGTGTDTEGNPGIGTVTVVNPGTLGNGTFLGRTRSPVAICRFWSKSSFKSEAGL